MEAYAVGKYIKGSAQKARLVIDTIRGRNVNDALAILRFTNKRAAKPIEKVLRSAIANATQQADKENISVDVDRLIVNRCHVDIGVTKWRRRVRPAPMGRAYRERRHYCHITVHVASEKAKEKPVEQVKETNKETK
ncbi:MAG: 50S ribosomal protein L22 [Acidobacteriota bacterium]